jgi:mannosyltransferase
MKLPRTHRRTLSLILVLWLALWLRTHNLSQTSLWNDEGNTVMTARQGVGWTISQVLVDSVHPPLFFFLEKINIALLGDSEFSLRWLSAAFGVVGVAALYRLGRQWLDAKVGWLVAIGLALVPFAVWYSREARMYSLVVLLNIGVMYWFGALLENNSVLGKPPAFKTSAFWFVLLSATLYVTHYFGLFAPLIQFVYMVVTFRRHHRSLLPWAFLQAIAVLPIALWLYLQFNHGLTLKISWIQPPTFFTLFNTWVTYTVGGTQLWQVIVSAGFALLVLFSLRFIPSQRRWLLLLWLSLPTLVTLAFSVRRPLYVDRYMIGSLAPLLLLAAVGLAQALRYTRTGGTVIALVLAGSMFWQNLALPDYHSEDWRGAVQYVTSHEESSDQLLRRSIYYWTVDYYYHGPVPVQSIDGNWQPSATPTRAGRLWLVIQTTAVGSATNPQPVLDDVYRQSPDLETQAWFQDLAPHLKDLQQFGGVTVLLYDFSTPAL